MRELRIDVGALNCTGDVFPSLPGICILPQVGGVAKSVITSVNCLLPLYHSQVGLEAKYPLSALAPPWSLQGFSVPAMNFSFQQCLLKQPDSGYLSCLCAAILLFIFLLLLLFNAFCF